jgi:phospholipase/carboxylesterase
MNRLELPTLPLTVPTHTIDWAPTTGDKTRLRVVGLREHRESRETPVTFSPIHYESGYTYPLVVWLHDVGQSAACLGEAMKFISVRNYVAVAPQGDDLQSANADTPWNQSPSEIASAEQRIVNAIAHAQQQFQIHSARVFLIGFGVGGTMAMRIALQCPERFAGAATIGGPLPVGHCPLRRINAIRDFPLLIASARRSKRYPERQVCANLRLLHSAGATVSLRQYPGADELTSQMLIDVDHWMMELIGQSSAVVVH